MIGNGDLVHDETGDAHISENSWEGETPPLDLNYEALKHIVSVFSRMALASMSQHYIAAVSTRSECSTLEMAGVASRASPVTIKCSARPRANWPLWSMYESTPLSRYLEFTVTITMRTTLSERRSCSWSV
jgi:hypothetical protein